MILYIALIVFVLFVLPSMWILRSVYYSSPDRRRKWHQFDEPVELPVGPEQVQPVRQSTLITNTNDASKWNTVEIANHTLTIKNASGENLRQVDLRSICKVTSPNPGVVIVHPEKVKFFSAGGKQTIALDFRLPLMTWAAWNQSGLVQTLPPKWLVSSNSKLVEADRKALTFYYAIQKAGQP